MKYIKKLLPRKRSRTSKKIFGFLLIFGLSGIALQGNVGTAEVHAQTLYGLPAAAGSAQTSSTASSPTIDKMGVSEVLDLLLKVVYILLWPLLVIAGRSLDNTLVYGSLFHLDVPLWKFWNMMKNFANFTMGFMVLYAILKSFFTKEGVGSLKEGKTPLGIIKNTLIAGVLIQASRFLFAAAIDVSTVATYAVGGLPLNVIRHTQLGEQKILSTNTSIDFNKFTAISQAGGIFDVTYSVGPYKISACQLSNNSCGAADDPFKYIVGRKQRSGTEVGKCILRGSKVMVFDEVALNNDAFWSDLGVSYDSFVHDPQHCINETQWDTRASEGKIVNIYSGSSFSGSKLAGEQRSGRYLATKLSDLVSKSKGFVGPLVTIYSSMLNFAEISDTGRDNYGKMTGEMFIRVMFAIMLFFPLLALAVVLIARVGYLWLIIAASPFVILAEVFESYIPETLKGSLKNFKIGNIFGVIFAPVITVFALSIALIFMSTLINTLNTNKSGTSEINTALEPQIVRLSSDNPSVQKYSILGSEMTLTNFNRGGSLDRFSRLLVNLVAVGLMRALLFAAIKSNSLGKSIGGKIQTFGEGLAMTTGFIPTPWGKLSATGVKDIEKQVLGDGGYNQGVYIQRLKNKSDQSVQEFMDKAFPSSNAGGNSVNTEKLTTVVTTIQKNNGTGAVEAFESQGISKENIGATIANNSDAVYQAIQKIEEKDRAVVGKAIGEAINNPKRYDDILGKEKIKTDFTTLLKLSDNPTADKIKTVLNDPTNLKAIEEYFKTNTEYTNTINNGEALTITKPDVVGKFEDKNIVIIKQP